MSSTDNPGRVAGLWDLLLIVIGPLRLIYIPTKLFVDGNATATVNNIAAHEWLFRFGIVSDLVCGVMLIFLVHAFYRLFKGVDQTLAVLVVIFGDAGPLALLVYRSRFLPRFLGVWLAIGGFAYVILSLTGELLPRYQEEVFTYSQPAFFGEVAIMLWLVIKGAKPPADATGLSSAASASPWDHARHT
jgi:hypothetical protein